MDNNSLSPETSQSPLEEEWVRDEIAHLPEVVLTEKLNSSDLDELRRFFYPTDQDHGRLNHEKGYRADDGTGIPLSRDEFAKAIYEVIGNLEYEISARKLFDKLLEEGQLSDGLMWWNDLLEVIIRGCAEAQLVGAPPTKRIKEKRNVLVCHCKSPIVRVLLVETPHSACYVVVSKQGNVGVYDHHMEVKVKYAVPMEKYKTPNCCWVTDAVYASEANGVVIAASTRNLYFYNSSQIVHKLLFVILGIANVPCCLSYCAAANREAVLAIGDDKGSITTLHFHQPNKSFFQPQPDKEATTYFWIQLNSQKLWVDIGVRKNVHSQAVNMVEYFADNKCTVSCSNDPYNSLVMKYKEGKQTPYVTSVEKGIRRFHLDKRIGLLMTVSNDYTVKMWNPVVTRRPLENLDGHVSHVADVAILKHIRSILSISVDAVMKVWDIESHSCVQTLHLNFPQSEVKLGGYQKHIYPGIRQVSYTEETGKEEPPQTDKPAESDETYPLFKKDIWLRSEIVVVYGKYLKVIELESIHGLSVEPLPLPRRNLEAILPTPYYPLTHTFRENTKALKQKMFKNLAGLAPFNERSSITSVDLSEEYADDTKTMKMLVKNGVPHLALTLCKIKPLPPLFFKIRETPVEVRE